MAGPLGRWSSRAAPSTAPRGTRVHWRAFVSSIAFINYVLRLWGTRESFFKPRKAVRYTVQCDTVMSEQTTRETTAQYGLSAFCVYASALEVERERAAAGHRGKTRAARQPRARPPRASIR